MLLGEPFVYLSSQRCKSTISAGWRMRERDREDHRRRR